MSLVTGKEGLPVKALYTLTAVTEVVTGSALIWRPSAIVALLLGAPLNTPAAVALGRVAGVALFALGVACQLARPDAQSRAARGLVTAMALYNAGVVAILSAAGMRLRPVGVVLWPAVVLHTALGVWCVACLRRKAVQDH